MIALMSFRNREFLEYLESYLEKISPIACYTPQHSLYVHVFPTMPYSRDHGCLAQLYPNVVGSLQPEERYDEHPFLCVNF